MKIVDSVEDITNEELQALYERWLSACPPGKIPLKELMRSTKIQSSIAGNCKIVIADQNSRFFYESVGEAVQNLYDVPMARCYVDELYDPWIRNAVIKTYETSLQTGMPIFERKGFSTVFGSIGYEYLVLPFADESANVSALLSCVFPVNKDLKKFSDWYKKISVTPWLNAGN